MYYKHGIYLYRLSKRTALDIKQELTIIITITVSSKRYILDKTDRGFTNILLMF